jgi:hypothetical protein
MAQAAPWACVESLCRVDDGGERGHMWSPLERFRRRCPIVRPWLAALQPLLATSVNCERLFILRAANRQPQQRHGCHDRVLVPRARRQLSQQTLACDTIFPTPNRRPRCCNPLVTVSPRGTLTQATAGFGGLCERIGSGAVREAAGCQAVSNAFAASQSLVDIDASAFVDVRIFSEYMSHLLPPSAFSRTCCVLDVLSFRTLTLISVTPSFFSSPFI